MTSTINVSGEVVLCCLDWKNKYVFGDLKCESLNDVINKDDFKRTYRNKGNLDICRRCTMGR